MTARVGIIGARRVRQGLGPFVARHLAALGAAPPCFLGTLPDTVSQAERELSARLGSPVRGYTDLRRMLERESLDALAILSPAETHEHYLGAALEAGLHVLCEKPLVWGGTGLAARAAAFERRFAAAGLGLRESCQWPYTLPAYRRLHPEAGPVRSFAMRLSPASREPRAMLGDSLSHPLSLLQALVPAPSPRTEAVQLELAEGRPELRLRLAYCAGDARVDVEVRLTSGERLPREAGYAVNGRWAERRIRSDDYAFGFADGEREVPVPDPLRALLADFVAKPSASTRGVIAERMALLEEIVDALPARGEA